jgi:hypothetical protein
MSTQKKRPKISLDNKYRKGYRKTAGVDGFNTDNGFIFGKPQEWETGKNRRTKQQSKPLF